MAGLFLPSSPRGFRMLEPCGPPSHLRDHGAFAGVGLRRWVRRRAAQGRRSPCPSCPTTHPPYVPRPSAVDHLGATC
jgi:hypothetical protein